MSSGENVKVSYFSALLAKALKQNDGDQFIQFYDLICKRATEDEVNEAKENARNLSNLPLQTLIHKISWLEKLGVKPLRLPEQEKVLPKMISAAPKKEISTIQSDLSEPLFEDDKAFTNRKFSFGDSNKAGFSGETSLVELRNRMASRDPAQTDFNFAYIDENEEDVVRDESPPPLATQDPGISISENTLPEKSKKEGHLKSSTPRFQSDNRHQDCVIDMSAAEDLMKDSWEFFSPCTNETRLKVDLFKVTNMTKSDDTSNVEQSLENPSVKHEDKNDDAPCSSKTDNKGKKSKPKESNVRQSFDKNPKKASVPDVQKSSKLRKSISSETQPLLGGEHSRSRDYGTERPARKRTIKSFLQEEKNRPVHLVSESNGALQGSHRISKTEQRLKEEKRKNEMFPDEKINEILRILGDDSTVEASSKTKKKSKENKHNAPKKNKKKLTKQKKVDKTKDLKVSGETAKPNSSLASVHVNAVQEDFLSLVPCSAVNEMTSEDDVNEFVTQKKRKGVHKQPTSGHVSPKNIAATNKRRFSDPSPTISKNPGQAFFQGRRSPCDQDRNVKDHNNVSLRSDPPFDRDCQSHWPTLPLLSGTTNCKSVSGGNAASYASKLKSNLDSTGCSLASSSEDGSSTSSASSNNCNASTGFINSATERHVSALSNMPLFIEAATHIMKNLTPMNDCKETQYDHPLPPIKPFLTEVEPIRILERVVHGTNQTESFDFAKTGANAENAAESKANPTDSLAATSDDQHEAIKTSCDTPRPTVPDEPALPRDVEIDANRSQDRLLSEYEITNDVIFEFTSDCDDTNYTDIQILSELENKWGLGFFTQDFSENNLETAQSPDVPVKLLESRKMKVSFGDNKVLSDVDSKHTAPNWDDVNVSKPSTDNVVFLLPSMRISSNMNEWNDPGHFQLRSAVNVLLQEWNTAVSEGKYYQE